MNQKGSIKTTWRRVGNTTMEPRNRIRGPAYSPPEATATILAETQKLSLSISWAGITGVRVEHCTALQSSINPIVFRNLFIPNDSFFW